MGRGRLGWAAIALALLVSGCGGDGGDEETTRPAVSPPTASVRTAAPAGKGTTLEIPADAGGEFEFQKDSLTARAGRITLVMENPSSEIHNIAIEGDGVDEKGEFAGEGETSRVSAVLEPGDYTFYCSVPLHRDAGMEGALTVTEAAGATLTRP
jgi:plastocyanin